MGGAVDRAPRARPGRRRLERRCGSGGGALRRCGATREQGRQAPAVGLGRGGQVKCRARQSRAHTTQSSCGAGRGWALRARPGRRRLERRCGGGGGALRRCGATREQGRQALAVGLGLALGERRGAEAVVDVDCLPAGDGSQPPRQSVLRPRSLRSNRGRL